MKLRIRDQGFTGLKLYNQHRIDEAVLEPIIEQCIAWRVPILVHAGRPMDAATKALTAFLLTMKLAGETKEGLNNVGSACAEHNLPSEAEHYFSQALELDPSYELSLRNLGSIAGTFVIMLWDMVCSLA